MLPGSSDGVVVVVVVTGDAFGSGCWDVAKLAGGIGVAALEDDT